MKRTVSLSAAVLFAFVACSDAPTPRPADPAPDWTQVYADEELQIDLDTSWVGDNEGVPQVRVRWKWSQQRSLRMTPGVSYQSRIEILEMDCSRWRIHTASAALFDSSGEEIEFDRVVPSTRWDEIEPDSLADIIAGPACDLIKSNVRQ